ncbi:hypothetical protein TSUD_366060 [Trifolium subterraneum]|uniref:Uncharacterized protein n=1 Tax=Trifolium subterraneum TaxID=3900 RepID=A0A2Z6PBN1_TRISU|nr:hypothetical protein TSUD_366060 [Trifolium subterraneum]
MRNKKSNSGFGFVVMKMMIGDEGDKISILLMMLLQIFVVEQIPLMVLADDVVLGVADGVVEA